ncbi:hypothetical protein CWR48_16980 [Oceanobacillus arenosus]|uniref:Potassium transporter n=1 Tax=Oceanobacillus arenosus TaxID=1229153 RepID=A0A3D8PM72_9BACI|nr:hypothetical protein [Oceanobacillus arenosus]RDW16338.1 hypothetical protein CWR48_16980 [Oceanobacillus arenosus]
MNSLFQENKKSFLLLLGLVFVLIIVAYFLFYQPLTKELKAQKSQVTQLQSDIALFNVQLEHVDNDDSLDMDIENVRLANIMPPTPELESLVKTLNEIELMSGSRIEELRFSYDGSLPERVVNEEAVVDSESAVPEEPVATEDVETDSNPEVSGEITPVIAMPEKPENLHLITVSMDIASPDYEHFQILLKEIEKQERIMMVNRLEFDKPAESVLMIGDEANESIIATIDITTFYFDEK